MEKAYIFRKLRELYEYILVKHGITYKVTYIFKYKGFCYVAICRKSL
ncbi:MAG: hypothetical protein BAJALOKI1v1_90018 [Promethearchaeota archaeon]|nr:MAG: hypothetical protein BAJALOKI1v1_90018 [Candidatus Lokiarchaeota archaeon]